MNSSASHHTPLRECPYLRPGSPAFYLARALYDGEPLPNACARLNIKRVTASSMLMRLRRRASAYADRTVNETFTLRLLFDRAGAEQALGIGEVPGAKPESRGN